MLPKPYQKYKDLEWSKTALVEEEPGGKMHVVVMPDLPANPNNVFFINDDPENAYWNRDRILKDYKPIWFKFIPNETILVGHDEEEEEGEEQQTTYDDDGYAKTLNKEDSDYIRFCYEREMERRRDGVYIRIKNTLTHITGDHWFTLMWCKTKRPDKKSDYFDYREYQRDFFYLIKHTNESANIDLCDWSKAKKTGITNLMWCYYLNKSTMTKNINLGHMSIDSQKAAKTFRDHFMYAYYGLPLALKPDYKSLSENEGRITFGRRYNSKASKRSTTDDELNTTVMCVPTVINAFDVDVFSDIWYDEAPKYKFNFGEIFRSNIGGTKLQDYAVGKQWITSYTPEQSGESFTEAKKIFYDSELSTITEYSEGRTKSGGICCHIPAFKSWATSFDKYGKCNEVEAKQKIKNILEGLQDRPSEFLKIKRQYANTKRDAWSVGDSSSVFDPIRLTELEIDLEERQRAEQTFEWGHFEWENPIWELGKKDKRPKGIFGPVKWVPISEEDRRKGKEDKARLYNKPPAQHINQAIMQGRDEYGNLLPPDIFNYCGGIDPADWKDAATADIVSNIAIDTMAVQNTARNTLAKEVVTKIQYAEYLARPDNPYEWYEDIVKQILYFSQLIIVEANNAAVATKLEEEGLGHYMLFKNQSGVICFYKANHKNLPIEMGGKLKNIANVKAGSVDVISDIIILIKSYLQRANSDIGEIDYGALIRSERFFKQAKEFDPKDTRRFDLVMAKGYALMCHENYIALLEQHKEDPFKEIEVNSIIRALEKWT
jgi:hypothetical protein